MNKVTKTLATVCFSLILAALACAIISDIIILNEQILAFVGAILISILAFVVGFILMVISIMLIFGIYLLGSEGFWPLKWAKYMFSEVLKDHVPTAGQLNDLLVIRIILLVLCVMIFITSIVTLAMLKKEKKKNPEVKVSKRDKGFATAALVLSLLGTLASTGIVLILHTIIK